MIKEIIYFDNNSTTRTDPRVVDEMLPYFTEHYGNPSSVKNKYGFEASAAINLAVKRIRDSIDSKDSRIVFTSGATESINLAITGIITASGIRRIITSTSEHSAVLETCRYLEGFGVVVEYLDVNSEGLIDLFELENLLRAKRPTLVTIMGANNETGVINDIRKIKEICYRYEAVFHSDITQLYGKTKDFAQFSLPDMVSLSAHKFYGPKGIGLLVINSPSVSLNPLIHGGGQQDGLRAGTLPVPLIVGIGKACELVSGEIESDLQLYSVCRTELLKIMDDLPFIRLNGSKDIRIFNNLNYLITGIDTDSLMSELNNFALSTAAACKISAGKKSHVLKSMGLSPEQIKSSIRIGIGRFNTPEEAVFLRNEMVIKIKKLSGKEYDGK